MQLLPVQEDKERRYLVIPYYEEQKTMCQQEAQIKQQPRSMKPTDNIPFL